MALFARAADNAGYQAILMPGRDLLLTSGGQCAKRRVSGHRRVTSAELAVAAGVIRPFVQGFSST